MNQQDEKQGELEFGTPQVNVSETQAIMTIENSDPVSHLCPGPKLSIGSLMPYKFETPRTLINREFYLFTDDVTTGFYVRRNYLYTLLNKPAVLNIMKNFLYARISYRLKFVLTSTIFVYGFVGITPYPCNAYGRLQYDYASHNEEYQTWSMFAARLDPQDSTNVEIDLPWSLPKNFARTDSLIGGNDITWTVATTGIDIQTVSTEVSPSTQVQVYGYITDIELSGQCDPVDVGFVDTFSYEKQMNRANLERYGPAFAAAMRTAGQAGTLIKGVGAGIGVIGAATGVGSFFGSSEDQEVFDTGVAVENLASVMETLQAPGSQPQVDQGSRSAVRQNFYGNMASFNTGTCFQSISDRPSSTLMKPMLLGSSKKANFMAMIRQWATVVIGEMQMNSDQSTNPYCLLQVAPDGSGFVVLGANGNVNYEAGYLSYWSQFFKFWRGSIEYRVTFASPMMVSARVNYVIVWDQSTLPYNCNASYVLSQAGTKVASFIAIKGTTTFEITVPFLHERLYKAVGDMTGSPIIMFTLTSMEPRLKTATPIVLPYVVEKRAGPDFTFRQFDGGMMEIVKSSYEKQMNNEQWDDSNSNCNINGLCMRLARSKTYALSNPGADIVGSTSVQYTESYSNSSLQDKCATLFLYYTGTLGYKVVYPSDQNLEYLSASYPVTKAITNSSFTGTNGGYFHSECGMAMTDQNTFRMLEFEVPFESQYAAWFTCDDNTSYGDIIPPLQVQVHSRVAFDQTPAWQTIFECVRPDFEFMLPIPPPNKLICYDKSANFVGTEPPLFKPQIDPDRKLVEVSKNVDDRDQRLMSFIEKVYRKPSYEKQSMWHRSQCKCLDCYDKSTSLFRLSYERFVFRPSYDQSNWDPIAFQQNSCHPCWDTLSQSFDDEICFYDDLSDTSAAISFWYGTSVPAKPDSVICMPAVQDFYHKWIVPNCVKTGYLVFEPNKKHIVALCGPSHISVFEFEGEYCNVAPCEESELYAITSFEPFVFVEQDPLEPRSGNKDYIIMCECYWPCLEKAVDLLDQAIVKMKHCHQDIEEQMIEYVETVCFEKQSFQMIAGYAYASAVVQTTDSNTPVQKMDLRDYQASEVWLMISFFSTNDDAADNVYSLTCSDGTTTLTRTISDAGLISFPGDYIENSPISIGPFNPSAAAITVHSTYVSGDLCRLSILTHYFRYVQGPISSDQPLWVSNFKVSDSADGVTEPLQVSYFKQ
jgi:hypothetical protein